MRQFTRKVVCAERKGREITGEIMDCRGLLKNPSLRDSRLEPLGVEHGIGVYISPILTWHSYVLVPLNEKQKNKKSDCGFACAEREVCA